jgi:hypothetical protein
LSDPELLTLAVAQVLLGVHSAPRWLRFVPKPLPGAFPYLPGQSGYNKRLRGALPLLKRAIRAVATDTDLWGAGRRKLVMAGIVTSVCLAFAVVDALADGYEVTFIEDAVADATKEIHDAAVRRLAHAGAVSNTTVAMTAEWFRDWKSPLADTARELWVPYKEEWAALKRAPKFIEPKGMG